MKSAWVDGCFEGHISPHDEGFLFGRGVFETMGVFARALPLWPVHLRRLERNAAALGIPFAPRDELRDIALELLARDGDDVLRLTLSAGAGDGPTWCMTTRRRSGVKGPVRLHPTSTAPNPTAAIKTTSRAFYSGPLEAAHAAGADDALLVDLGGRVLETTTANVFLFRGDELRTPRLDGCVLPGVGREALIAELAVLGVGVEESDCRRADLEEGDGLFITNAVYGPRPALLAGADAAPIPESVLEAWQIATARSRD